MSTPKDKPISVNELFQAAENATLLDVANTKELERIKSRLMFLEDDVEGLKSHGLERDSSLPKTIQDSNHTIPYEVTAGQVLTADGLGGATFETPSPALHTRLHEMDEPLDHDASAAADKAKFVQSNPTTGAIEFSHKFNDTATTNPTVNDDSTAGYSVGSTWTNVTTDLRFVCSDASAGAANWLYMVNSRSTSVLGNIAAFTGTSGQEIQDSLIAGADVTATISASHARSHAITGTSDHTSTATSGQILKADVNGLPVDATNTDAEVSAAVTASHARAHSATSASDHSAATGADKGKYLFNNAGTGALEWQAVAAGTGDVVGPGVAVDGNLAAFDTTTGKLIKDSGKPLTDVHSQNTDSGTTGNTFTVDSDSTTGKIIVDVALGAADKSLTLTNSALTDNRVATFQDLTGTVELTGHAITSHAAATGGDVDKYLHSNAGTGAIEWVSIAGGGDVTGPAGAVDGNVCAFDGVTGKLLKDSAKALTDIHTQNTDTGTTGNTFTIDSDSTTGKIIIDVSLGLSDKSLTISNETLTDNRSVTFRDRTGEVELVGHDMTTHAAATGGDVDKYIHSNAGTGTIEWVTGASINTNKLMVSADDTTPGYVEDKITAGTGIALTTASGGGNETRSIAVAPSVGSCTATQAGEHCEFFNLVHHWNSTPLSSGTINTYRAAVANHPGILMIRSHATNANSGGALYTTTNATAFLLAGYETTELVFKTEYTTNLIMRFGFQDSGTTTAPTDGAYIALAADSVSGVCVAATTSTSTATTYTLSASTWYRAKIVVNSNATSVAFYLYDAAGSQLWTSSVTTNIPTAAGQETGHGVVAYNSNPGSQREILDVDYLGYYFDTTLVR